MEAETDPTSTRPEPGLTEAGAAYLAARLELVRIEAEEAARQVARRGVLAAIVAALAAFAWALLLAGLVGWGSAVLARAGFDIPWHLVAVGFGLLHLLAAGLFGVALARPAPPAFQTTRTELEKDRAWIRDLRRQIDSRN